MQPILALAQKILTIALCLALGACATLERTKPAPAVNGSIAIEVNAAQLSGWSDLPIGAYKVPDSDVIIAGHQRGTRMAGALLGVIGLALAHASNSTATAAGVAHEEQVLHISLAEQTRAEIATLVAQPPMAGRFTLQGGSGSAQRLDVSSALLLSYADATRVRAYSVLKVVLTGANQQLLWQTRYFAASGEARPLEGPGSWTENGGESLRSAVAQGLHRTVQVMLHDVVQPYPRETALTVAETTFPFLAQRLQIKGYNMPIGDEKYIGFVPRVGDGVVLSGVHVFDRAEVSYHAPGPDGSPIKSVAEGASAQVALSPTGALPPDVVMNPPPDAPARAGAVAAATQTPLQKPQGAVHLELAMVAHSTWIYAHRNAARFGDVEINFGMDTVAAHNRVSHTNGHYQVADDRVCLSMDHRDWGNFCYYLVKDEAGLSVVQQSGRKVAVTIR